MPAENTSEMDFKQLKAVIAVSETGSVTRAAQLLHLVQPAVTRQIKALEHELGVTLFERSPAGMHTTAAGEILVDRARRALTELDRVRTEIVPTPHDVRGIVTVGILDSMSDIICNALTSVLAQDYPGIRLRIVSAYSGHLQQWLDDGDLDLTLLYNLKKTSDLNVTPLAREQLWLIAPSGGAVLDPENAVDLTMVDNQPFVLPNPGHGLRILIDQAAVRAGITVTTAAETNSMRVQKQLVQGGHGWTILPGISVANEIAAGTLQGSPIADPLACRDVVKAVPRTAHATPAVEVVDHALTSLLKAATDSGAWPQATWHAP